MGYQDIQLEVLKMQKLNLKLLFFTHFVLISWATLDNWALNACFVHNILLLICLVWSIAIPESVEPIFISLGVNLLSVLFDIIIVSIYYPRLSQNKTAEFSAVMAIFNLLFRFVSGNILYKEWGARGGLLRTVNHHTTQDGSDRRGSVLAHYPGQVLQIPPTLPPPTYMTKC